MTAPACPFCEQVKDLARLPRGDLIGQLPHSVVLLGTWQFYHGYCLVVSRRHATELSQLEPATCRAYLEEMCLVAKAIEEVSRPYKLNYELLGNQVPHLHWHLFPRYQTDPAARHPVWLALARAEDDPAERRRLQAGPADRESTAARLRDRLTVLAGDSFQPP
jgi:diadenosine tetraphosphate (Ap4A) HIT family hydrolase